MLKRNVTRSDLAEFDGRVGKAMDQHIRRQFEQAIELYKHLLEEWPDHLDANYGLALSLKAAGRNPEATDAFKKTRTFVEVEMGKTTGETARFQMLLRMIDEQLAQLGARQ
jgi:tetratricopeptide (TPR) repeat protein